MIESVVSYLKDLQDRICQAVENEDGKAKFQEDAWHYQRGYGGGRTRVITRGDVFEQGGVNFSHISGDAMPAPATKMRPELAGRSFQATGVSLVLHPQNPFVPTTHLNVRFFIAEKKDAMPIWWFGGGYDLTPYYGFDDDCQHWHQTAKVACDSVDSDLYPHYKKWADDYFYLKHRQECRGIGGIFFDDVNELGFERSFELQRAVGDSFLQAYLPIVQKRKDHAFNEQQRQFQLYRRGRYVEFNLIYDRGTLFGLQSGGRTESILMSLPPAVSWRYNWQPEPDSIEARLTDYYLLPRDWV